MRKMRKLLSAIIALLLVMGLSPAKPAKADTTETISITYTSTVNDGDAPVLPTISSGYEFVGGTFIEDTNKNDTFHDDKVMVMDQATLQAMAAQLSITPEDLISVAAAQGTTIRTTFRSGYNYAFTGQIKRSDNTLFSGADGDPFTGIIYVNGTDKTSRFEISDGLIAVPNDSGIIYTCVSSGTTKTLKGITITTAPTTTVYTEGQSFDSAGMIVTATYSDNSSAEVKTYTVSPSGALATTDTSVTISYTEGGVTKTATQKITVNPGTNSFKITFDANGHGTAPAAQTVESGKTATKPSDPTASGWTFGGWYTEATCTNAFDFSKAITDDFTLYAKWTEGKAPEEIVYTVTVGGNSSVTQGNDMTITVKRSVADETCINHFTGIQIDGKPCAAGDYEAKAGSTIVTLKTATIQSLSAGTHTITVLFDDGKTETKLTVEEATPANNSGTDQSADTGNNSGKTGNEDIQSPKTGDKFTDGIYVLMILSAICMCGAVVIGKMRRNIGRR